MTYEPSRNPDYNYQNTIQVNELFLINQKLVTPKLTREILLSWTELW